MNEIVESYFRKMVKKLPEMIEFEILYGILSFAVGYPVIKFFLYYAEKFSGSKYITLDTVKAMLMSPISIIMLLIVLFWLVLFTAIEISGLLAIYYNDRKYHFLSFRVLGSEILEDMRRLLVPKNFPMIFWIFVLFPITGNISTFIKQRDLPGFILLGIYEKAPYIAIFIILSLFFIFLYIRNIFIYIAFFTENKSFFRAKKKAVRVIKNRFFMTVLLIGLNAVFLSGVTGLINFIWHEILTGIIYSFENYSRWLLIPIMIARTLLKVMPFLSNALIIIGNVVMTGILYEYYSKTPISYEFKGIYRKSIIMRFKKELIIAGIALLIGNAVITHFNLKNGIAADLKENYITAHRGNSGGTPENSLSGIQASIMDGADYIEVDLQLTKDGEIILLHDKDFRRTGNSVFEPGDLKLEEIKKINIGKAFSPEYQDEYVPTMDEVFDRTVGSLKYNLELKPYDGSNIELARKTVELIEKYRQEENVTVTSLYKDCLREVKRLNPDIKTGYIMVVAGGNFYDMKDIDVFCIEESFITEERVAKVHLAGKEVYAWTVNEKESMDRMLRYQVDNMITDNVKQAVIRRSYDMNKLPFFRSVEQLVTLENGII